VGPGIEANRKIQAPIYLQDVMPTTLELAGIQHPDHVDFHSLMPLLRRETSASAYGAVYGAYLALQRSITMEDYKLILYPVARKARLYHLSEDPLEMHDLADGETQQPRMRRLFHQLLSLQQTLGDDLRLEDTFSF
jgi:choline-sulfatase